MLDVTFKSAALSAFWGQPVYITGVVVLPDSYYRDSQERYPVVYYMPGFGWDGVVLPFREQQWLDAMRRLHLKVIVAFMNLMFNNGAQEFADSATYGPWGTAFTQEFVRATDAHFRTIATAADRFVAGHSSGGWSALWLQVTYPALFGGCWAIAPDPVDFRSFMGSDLTKDAPGNFYADSGGQAHTVDGMSLRAFLRAVPWAAAQFDSFDAVFSPEGSDGKPEPLFDRGTGRIDPAVAAYWVSHYDIATRIRSDWSTLGPSLRGKVHVIVGSDDNFDLAPPVLLFGAELQELGADAEVDIVPHADHFTVERYGGNPALFILNEIAKTGALPGVGH